MKLLKLREDCGVWFIENHQVELVGPLGRAVLDIDEATACVLRRLREGIATTEIKDLPASCRAFLAGLAKNGLLITVQNGSTRTQEWISHATHDASAIGRLETSLVMVIGCGGTGSIVADHLARIGIRRFVLIDDAVLDSPDLNRQLPYRHADLGQKKVAVLAHHLQQFGAQVQTVVQKLDSEQMARELSATWKADLVFCCADTPPLWVQIWASRLSSFMRCPVVFGSVGVRDYVVGPLLVSEDDKEVFCNDRLRLADSADDYRIISCSICINNTMAAVEQAWLGVRFLLSPTENAYKHFDNISTIVDVFSGTRTAFAWREIAAREPSGLVPD